MLRPLSLTAPREARATRHPSTRASRYTKKGPAAKAAGPVTTKAAVDYSSRATPKSCSSIWNRLMKLRYSDRAPNTASLLVLSTPAFSL